MLSSFPTRVSQFSPFRRVQILVHSKYLYNCFATNETEHILQVNDYKYPVTFTKCTATSKSQSLPTVLLPAMGQTITDYPWLKEYLSQFCDVITIAHTSTPHDTVRDNADYFIAENLNGFETDVQCIRHTMDYFNITKSNFLGISFGGIMISLFARQYPVFVNAMLLSSCGLYVSDYAERSMVDGLPYLYSGDHKTAAKMTAETFSNNNKLQRILVKHFTTMLKHDAYSKQYECCLERVVKYLHHKRYQTMLNLTVIAPNIETLLICAKSDALFPFNSSLCLAETIQNCQVEQVDGGHLWMLNKDKQEIFCQKAGDFLYRFGKP
eukprot:236879_1